MIRNFAAGNIDKAKQYISAYVMQSGSYFDFNKQTPEQVFHCFILGLVAGLRDSYIIRSNQEVGLGRFDMMIIPKDKTQQKQPSAKDLKKESKEDEKGSRGFLLEFKVAKKEKDLKKIAKEALLQTKEKGYFETFKQYGVGSVLALGLAFCGKKVEIMTEAIELTI